MSARVQDTNTGSFWRGMQDGDHVCQVYSDDASFLDSLTGFVGHGLWAGDSAVVIASNAHVVGLETRLRQSGLDLGHLRADDRYITLSPESTLHQFMVDGWPDSERFEAILSAVMARARGKGRAVRSFGEMVTLLWGEGHFAATVRLEHLWRKLAASEGLQVLCAYPRRDFVRGAPIPRGEIHAAHTLTVAS